MKKIQLGHHVKGRKYKYPVMYAIVDDEDFVEKILQWDDIHCTARVRIEKDVPTMEFDVFEIVARYEDKETGEYTMPEYELKGAKSSEEMTENLDEAQPVFRGTIKWDACSHVSFGDENGYIHLCGGRSWFNLIEAIKRIYQIAIEELPQDHSRDMFDEELFTHPNE